MTSGVYFSSVGYGWHLCATFSLFSRFWYGFFRLIFTLLLAPFQFFSILQVLVRGECGVCLHSAKLLLLFVLFRFPPSCGGAVGGTLSGVHSDPTDKRRSRHFRLFGSLAIPNAASHNTIHHTSFIISFGFWVPVH
jgi:hypothetical protein